MAWYLANPIVVGEDIASKEVQVPQVRLTGHGQFTSSRSMSIPVERWRENGRDGVTKRIVLTLICFISPPKSGKEVLPVNQFYERWDELD